MKELLTAIRANMATRSAWKLHGSAGKVDAYQGTPFQKRGNSHFAGRRLFCLSHEVCSLLFGMQANEQQ